MDYIDDVLEINYLATLLEAEIEESAKHGRKSVMRQQIQEIVKLSAKISKHYEGVHGDRTSYKKE